MFNAIKVIGTDVCSFTALRERIRKEQSIGSGKAGDLLNRGVTLGYLICENSKYTIANKEWLPDDDNKLPF